MTTTELLAHLRQLNLRLRVEEDNLVLSGPKGTLTETLRAELAERKMEILALLENASKIAPHEPELQRVSRTDRLPLSFSQQRLWFLDQYEPDRSFYNIPYGLRLVGPLNLSALEQTLHEIVRRHEVLRTAFPDVDGEPFQMISPPTRPSLAVIDLRLHAGGEREDEARRLAGEEARRPFDLINGPVFRTNLIRLDEEDHILLLTAHHIVADGWSMGSLLRELAVLYRAFSQSQPSPLPELAIQFVDYTVWQREWLNGAELERQLSYWKKQLAQFPKRLDLPTDRGRPAVQSYRGARQTFELSHSLAETLKTFSRKEGATLFMILLAAFQTLLYRLSGQDDIVVGCPIANRRKVEVEGLIGFFANTLVLRTDFSGNPSFREMLQRVRRVALDAYEHQDLPFERLVEELNPERSLSHSPLFQAMFVLHNTPEYQVDLPGLTCQQFRLETDTTKFDMTMSLSEQPQGIKGSLEYSTDLFEAETIVRMSGYFRTLLEGIAAAPDRPISDLPLLTDSEIHELLVGWNTTDRDYPRGRCIHELFEKQVDLTPDAVAVIFENTQLTFRELNLRANQLARYLSKLGVGPESLVGVCMERSLEMIIGIMGILKAGAAYLPQDPRFPSERLTLMWNDARVAVLLSQERLAKNIPPFSGTAVYLDRDWEQISSENDTNLESGAVAENLAYVIYTSGSTGTPKGVQVAHHSVVNVLTHVKEAFALTGRDGLPLLANICFDISVMELFLPLITGAKLIVASSQTAVDGTRIGQLMSNQRTTIMHATPATWRLLLQAGWRGRRNITILCGGEALPTDLADELAGNGSKLWNLYGPTETTIYSTAAAYRSELGTGTYSIGRPISNTRIYILDDHLQPVPVGVPGHLYIGGMGLARGYVNRPEITAESFIPDMFSGEAGARMYRTGDLARYLPDGNLDYLGRKDYQIKLRGFRIELGEIEVTLREHSEVLHAVVLAREDVAGDKQLVAYVVLKQAGGATGSQLRAFVKEKLPEYMLPSAFVFLESFPLTSNGKIDRKRLPAPEQDGRPQTICRETAPRTPMEELLSKIWEEVLKLDSVSIYDNFFDLGGHSLKAAQVMSRVRDAVRLHLPVRIIFEAPTVAELALRIEENTSNGWNFEELARNLDEVEAMPEDEVGRRRAK